MNRTNSSTARGATYIAGIFDRSGRSASDKALPFNAGCTAHLLPRKGVRLAARECYSRSGLSPGSHPPRLAMDAVRRYFSPSRPVFCFRGYHISGGLSTGKCKVFFAPAPSAPIVRRPRRFMRSAPPGRPGSADRWIAVPAPCAFPGVSTAPAPAAAPPPAPPAPRPPPKARRWG